MKRKIFKTHSKSFRTILRVFEWVKLFWNDESKEKVKGIKTNFLWLQRKRVNLEKWFFK